MKISQKYKICIIGAGHVGLVSAACFSEMGFGVVCVDSDSKKIHSLKKKIMPFYEPGLDALVAKNTKKGNLVFSTNLGESVKKADIIFIVVGTPPLPDGSADLTSIENIARTIAANINSYKLIVEKSTVPVQTGSKVKETILRYRKNNVDFDIASNPEFLREGKAIYDFFHPDRIVLGVEGKRAETILRRLYSSIDAPLVVADINTSELIKHASNSFLATKISFINAVSRVCDLAGADVKKVALGMGLDKRIGKSFLEAGLGYGGFCFPKDLEAFAYISKKLGYNFNLLNEVENINDGQKKYFVEKIKEHLWVVKNKKIAILGLSFKPDTDDMRFAPSIGIVNCFLSEGAKVSLYDPQANAEAKKIFTNKKVQFAKNAYDAAEKSDCICILTEWAEFKKLDFVKLKKLMRYHLIADGRNMFEKKYIIAAGFKYIGMGV